MGDEKAIKELVQSILQKRLILFVGAGVPASIGMPTWKDLIQKMGEDLNLSLGNLNDYGDYLQFASYYESVIGSKSLLQEYIKSKSSIVKPRIFESEIYRSICNLRIKKLYTTNYDRTLEIAYHLHKIKHKTVRTIDDFMEVSTDPQIIKYHGDVDLLKSWVLSEQDYFKRLDFAHPMDVKLKADLIGNSVLYIGYSFSDMNIRYLIYKINQLWLDNTITKKSNSYILTSELNPVKENLLRSYGILPIKGYGHDPQLALTSFLKELSEALEDSQKE